MSGLLLLTLLWWVAPALAEDFLCAGSQGVSTKEIPPPGVAAKPAIAAQSRTTGTRQALVIFARFKGEDTALPPWDADLFNPDLPGSFSHFYDTMSFGKLQVRGEVAPRVYESSQPASAYLAVNSSKEEQFGQFSLEVLRQADQDLDFAQFDSDGPDGIPNSGDDDGVVDAVFLVLERIPANFLQGEATGIARLGFTETFVAEDAGKGGKPIQVLPGQGTVQQGARFAEAVGAMCHEYGHVLGLPDLYDTGFSAQAGAAPEEDSAGVGAWCLMGWGASGWNGNDGPNSFCAWSRMKLGWTETVEVKSSQEQIALEEVGQGGAVFAVPLTNREFFLVEYRRRKGNYYDRNIPGEGVLIWHVEENNVVAGRPNHLNLALECADGRWLDAGYPQGRQADSERGQDNLGFWAHDAAYTQQHKGNLGDATDPFDGVRFREFTPQTNPDSYSNDRRRSVRIENIRVQGERALAQVQTEPLLIEVDRLVPRPLVAGQESEIEFRLTNRGGVGATEVKAVLSTQDSLVQILQAEAHFRDLGVDQQSSAGPLGGTYPRLRFKDQFSGTHRAELSLDIYAGGVLVNQVPVALVAVSPRQRIREVVVIDSLGNGDGVAQPGELFRLSLSLEGDSYDWSLLSLLSFRLRHLDQWVMPTRGDLAVRFDPKKGASIHSPECLLSAAAVSGTEVAFEFEGRSEFGAWKDTFFVKVGEGGDHTPPQLSEPLVMVQGRDLEILLPERLVVDGSDLRSVKAQIYREADTTVVAEIPLKGTQGRYQGRWSGIAPGAYWVGVTAEDEVGNKGRSGLKAIYILPSPQSPPLPEPLTAILGKGFGYCAAYAPNGQLLAVGTSAGIWLYETTAYRPVGLLEAGAVTVLAFSPDGRLLASGGYSDTAVRVWDVEGRKEVSTLQEHHGAVVALKFSQNGHLLVSAGGDNVRVWRVGQGKEFGRMFKAGNIYESVDALDLAPDNRTLALHGFGVKVWDMISNQDTAVWHRAGLLTPDVAFSPDGQLLAMVSGYSRELVALWDVANRQEAGTLASPGGLTKIVFSPDRKILIAGGDLGIYLWELAEGQTIATLPAEKPFYALALSPDGQSLASVSGAQNNQVIVWNLAQQQVRAVLGGYAQSALKVVCSPDGRTLAVGYVDETIHLWDLQTQQERAVLKGHTRVFQGLNPGVHALAFSPDGRLLASGGGDGTVRVWDTTTQEPVEVIAGGKAVRDLAFSPDGASLAIVDYTGSAVRLWGVAQHQEVGEFKGDFRINALAYSPGGRYLVTGGNQSIALWDLAQGQEVGAFPLPPGEIDAVAFNPDGTFLAVGGKDGLVHLLDMENLQEVSTLDGPGAGVLCVAFSPDGQYLAIGGEGGKVSIGAVAEKRVVRILKGHAAGVNSLVFSPDGQTLATGSLDGTVRLWQSAEPTAVAEEQPLPATFSLSANYPNPFNPTTTIRISLPRRGEAELSIYNLLGQHVATLVHGVQEAGTQVLQWEGRDDARRELASGVYFYRLQAGAQVETRKLLLLR